MQKQMARRAHILPNKLSKTHSAAALSPNVPLAKNSINSLLRAPTSVLKAGNIGAEAGRVHRIWSAGVVVADIEEATGAAEFASARRSSNGDDILH